MFLIALQLAASGSDAYFTHRNLALPVHYESNPIARPFVHGTTGQIAFFGGGAALKIYGAHWLRKRNHGTLADSLALAGIADNASAATYSALH